jgi:hypothetical protein
MKPKKPMPTEEFVVRYWATGDDGFKKQEERSFFYFSKNRHKQAAKACVDQLRKEGKQIEIIHCAYQ